MGNLFGHDKKDKEETDFINDGKLQLRREEIDISKSKEQIGEVVLQKDVVEEEKTITVPITHDEVVIERKKLNYEMSEEPIGEEEVIRIPVSKERVHVDKDTFITGEISAHKREVEEEEIIKETLRREEGRVNKSGDVNIIDTDKH